MGDEKKSRIVKITLIQRGPATEDKEKTTKDLLSQFDEVLEKEKPDFIMPIELCTTPYFPMVMDDRYFAWAEPIPGPTTELFAEKARKYETCIILPIFEKGKLEGVYYNSAVVIGPDGNIISGTMPDGSRVNRYAKTHIPAIMSSQGWVDETFYFSAGPGFPVFDTPKAKIGILICHDRRYPEAWRETVLQGAEMIFVPVDSMIVMPERGGSSTEDMFVTELRTRALENCVWVCAANQGGEEQVQDRKLTFYGNSCIIHPTGKVVAQAPSSKPSVISATIDLEDVNGARRFMYIFKRRRPDLYKLINQPK
ncbi:carbon-nitrogen hydrolase family protein [Chloroflexota bacterium]